MGTTRDALNAGSTSYVLVVAVGGWSELFTNHDDTAAVATAWSGTGWTTVKGGLFCDLTINQALSPDEPIVSTGTCTITLAPQGIGAADVLGVAVGRKTAPYETYLDATLAVDGTSVQVKSTSGWPSSGYLYIGTECIAYSGIADSTHFTVSARGCFTPFGSFDDYTGGETTKSFNTVHHVGNDANGVNLQPVVSSTPRQWHGRHVGVWAHRVVGGVLDTKAEAELLFAGTINDVMDDANTGAVVFQLKPILDIRDVTIGGSLWSGVADDGVYLAAGDAFYANDSNDGSSYNTGTQLDVVASGASGTTEINAGYYTLGDLCSALSAWLAGAKSDGDIAGTYSMASPVSIPGGDLRTKVYWTLLGSGFSLVTWYVSMPEHASVFLGFASVHNNDNAHASNRYIEYGPAQGQSNAHWHEGEQPGRVSIIPNGGGSARALFTTQSGEVFGQQDSMPAPLASKASTIALGGDCGIFSVGDRLFFAQIDDNGDGTVELFYIQPVFTAVKPGESILTPYAPIVLPSNLDDPLTFKQVFIFGGDPITILISLLCAIGSYNTPYVEYPPQCSAQVPYELVAGLPNTLAGLSGITGPSGITMVVDKPTKFADLIRSDLVIRWVFLYWRNGEISAGQWQTPTATLAVESLSDNNKGEPSGNKVNHKMPTLETTEWLRPVVKIRYNRSAAKPGSDEYASTTTIVDRTSVDDAGGAANTVTINLRNTYAEFAGPTQSVKSLLPNFISTMTLVSRAARKVTRSADSRYFLRLGLGDIVNLTDTFARDPETGLRGLTDRPAMVTRFRWSLGGLDTSGSTTPMGGELDMLFSDQNPDRLGATYVPAAMVNDLYSLGSYSHGYDSAGPTLQLYVNRFTETSQGRDSDFFNPGDKVLIIERDPADPDAPVMWSRTIAAAGVSANAITLTSALSSPAWDATKQYYVISQAYSAATTTQHVHVYQADEGDGLIEDTTLAYLYGTAPGDATYTTNAAMASSLPFSYPNAIEMVPSTVRVDGAGRDVAWEAAIARIGNNLIDYKYAPSLSMLSNTVASNTTVTGTGYLLVHYFPVFLTEEALSNEIYRLMTVAPWAYSTDGTSTKIRVTLSRERPSFPTYENVAWSGTYAQYEWTGITSTSPATLSDGTLTVNVKGAAGEAWIAIECGYKCATRGLAKCFVGVRQS